MIARGLSPATNMIAAVSNSLPRQYFSHLPLSV